MTTSRPLSHGAFNITGEMWVCHIKYLLNPSGNTAVSCKILTSNIYKRKYEIVF